MTKRKMAQRVTVVGIMSFAASLPGPAAAEPGNCGDVYDYRKDGIFWTSWKHTGDPAWSNPDYEIVTPGAGDRQYFHNTVLDDKYDDHLTSSDTKAHAPCADG